ncbi:MAG TPA: FAD-dependent oxidoreductase [Pseudonocardiaceae bacterium]|nr:FAD-dependent oxidoreductase [Pseudonocardiaceae bacterium]
MARLVIVGAALAGLRAAEAARRFGFADEITLVGAEPHLPYDRPPLSTQFLTANPPAQRPPTLRGIENLAGLDVDPRLGCAATALDPVHRLVRVDNGGTDIDLAYDALLIATGSRARSLPGTEQLAGVHTLRTWEDARQIRAALDAGARTIVVGAGFIGSEVAASASRHGVPVTVLEALPVPLAGAIGPALGKVCAELHERNGVAVRCGVGVAAIEGDHGQVRRVRLAGASPGQGAGNGGNGIVLPADLVVVGIGAVPNTGWLATSGLDLAGGVMCDEYLAASAPGVYAAGDVARFANPVFGGERMRLEHWTTAVEQGVAAARNAVAELNGEPRIPFRTVPYFWSDLYDSRIEFVGLPSAEEIQVVVGGEGGLLAVYRRGDRLIGAFGVNSGKWITVCRGLIGAGAGWNEGLHALTA